MKQLADYIFSGIQKNLELGGDKQVIRVDGFENLGLYLRLCEKVAALCIKRGYTLVAKLSRSKFLQLQATGKWPAEAVRMQQQNWIDMEDHMTVFRNMLPANGKKLVVLMLGTDLVQDKGGLNDFFAITPSQIDASIGKEYAKLISPELQAAFSDPHIDDIVNRFFGDLFTCVPQNLPQVSDILDQWLEDTPTVQEAMEELFSMLYQWNIPPVYDKAHELSVKRFLDTKPKNSLIIRASNFICGKTYKRITKIVIGNITKQFSSYKNPENGKQPGKYACDYPEDQAIASLEELEARTKDFVMGNHSEAIIQQFLHTDFSILDDILSIPLSSQRTKSAITKVQGLPLSILLQVFMEAITANKGVDNVRIQWKKASLCGIPSNVEQANVQDSDKKDRTALLHEIWNSIVHFAGGVDAYLAQDNWNNSDGEPVSLSMTPSNFFSPDASADMIEEGLVTSGSGATHKIEFSVIACCGDTELSSETYNWVIQTDENWLLAFRDFSQIPDDENCYIPFGTIHDLNAAFSLKDADSFAYWITHAELKLLVDKESIWFLLQKLLNDDAMLADFCRLGKLFQNFRQQVLTDGFYASVNASAYRLLEAYRKLIEKVTSEPAYTARLHTIAGQLVFFFTICESTRPVSGDCAAPQVIVPPWHPAMLEKISDQMLFIRSGVHEWHEQPTDERKKITDRLDELLSLATIRNATDAFFSTTPEKFLTHSVTYGYYTLYGRAIQQNTFVSALQIEREAAVTEDDFHDSELTRVSRESHVLLRTIKQYVDTYPRAKRVLSIVIINPDDLQVVVSAIWQYLSELRQEDIDISTSLRLTVLTNSDIHGARTYLAYWMNHAFTQDDRWDIKAYLQVYDNESDIAHIIPPTTDLVFFFDALKTEQNARYHFYRSNKTEKMVDCRFPIVFKPSLNQRGSNVHEIDITQTQFQVATAHTQLLRVFDERQLYSEPCVLVQSSSECTDRGGIIRKVQTKTVWLCCIDNALDKDTVRRLYAEETGIIGFTTGEGSCGQMNLAITCQASMLPELQSRCERRLRKMFPSWTSQQLERAARNCLLQAPKLDGVSILRAMNPNDYDMNNYLAYLIASALTDASPNHLCVLIRLDSYRHWFDDEKKAALKIPDFLLLESEIKADAPLHLDATIIEAKISSCASMYSEHLPKAQQQVRSGRSILAQHFSPDSCSVESRYWLAQLYRAIAFLQSDMDFDDHAFPILKEKLENMIDGRFTISWHERILGCEIDSNCTLNKTLLNDNGMTFEYWQLGQLGIQNILLDNELDAAITFDSEATTQEEAFVDDSEDFVEESSIEESSVETEAMVNQTEEPVTASSATIEPLDVASNVNIKNESTEVPNVLTESQTASVPAEKVDTQPIAAKDASKKELEDIRVLIGQDIRRKIPIYWEFGHQQLANRHLLITGGSGQGKTYAIQTFLYELARQGISSVVFDYTDGFLPGKLEPAFEAALSGKIEQHYAITGDLPINPFKRQTLHIPGIPDDLLEQSTNVASRFAAIMRHVYSFGEQQTSALYQACKEGIDQFGNQMNFEKLRQLLSAQSSTYAKTVLSKMQQFFDLNLFDTQNGLDWSKITERDGKVTVIQLTNLDREIQTIITEMLMWDAWYALVKCGDKSRPFVVVLDEAQNLSITDGSPAQKILQEGRKYGWSAWFATQFMKGALSSDEISRLQQAAETLYFKPSAEETASVASMLSDNTMSAGEWSEQLKQMQKGHCIVKGDRIRPNQQFGAAPAVLVKVSSFEERI